MDLACFEVLERRIKALAKSFEQTQAENQQLRQQVHRLQQSVTAQQQALEQVQCERDDLLQVNAALNALRQEREVIQQKLRYMLETIEWLEKHTAISGESHAG
jgi:predicted nuclease with TOPRIM domain